MKDVLIMQKISELA